MSALSLLQLVSPALPVGAFSYSEGLEVIVQAGTLNDAQGVECWLASELERGAVRLEAAALQTLSADLKAWTLEGDQAARGSVVGLDRWLIATREVVEMRAQQRQMGGSLVELIAEMGYRLPEPVLLAWPAAWAWAALCLKVSEQEMVEGYLYGWVANQLSAAVRLVPLGPTRAQVLQQRLLPLIQSQAHHLFVQDPGQLWSSGVGASMAQLAHAELYSRLFRS